MKLSLHGVIVEIVSAETKTLSELRRDFSYFLTADAADGRADIRLELKASPPPQIRSRHCPAWRWRSARFADAGGLRLVDYEGKAFLEYDLRKEHGVLYAQDEALLHELAYLTVLSRVGERLDLRRLHRVHALGFVYKGRGGIVVLPSSGGKSRLALELLGRPDFKLLADDIPLLEGGGSVLRAFPLGLGLRGEDWRGIPSSNLRVFKRRRFEEKRVVDLDYFPGKIAASAPLAWIMIGAGRRDPAARARIEPCSKTRAAAALILPLVLGAGTPQVLELMIPPPPWLGGVLRLVKIAGWRAASLMGAVRAARCARFELGPSPRASADALEAFVRN